MKIFGRRLLSLGLTMILLVGMLCVGSVTVSAQTQAEAISRIAISQVGVLEGENKDYAYGQWCARFVA